LKGGVLLDTHVLLEMLDRGPAAEGDWRDELIHISVASVWEIAIKARQRRLHPSVPLADFESELGALHWHLLAVTTSHVVADVDPWPDTNDPFDRLLLAVCQVEGLRLVTRDRKLVDHPLAWPAASA
jgi:PIN domain nuclease of toxin-antitoxin system